MKQTAARMIKYCTPPILIDWAKRLLRPQQQRVESELNRLSRLPRYEANSTSLFGFPFELVDGLSFAWMYRDIFQREVYRFETTAEAPRIVDAGANVGGSVMYFKRRFPQCRITAIEADPQVFRVLEGNIRRSGCTNVELHQAAVWSEDGAVCFQPEGADAGRIAGDSNGTVCEVPSRRLRHYLNERTDLLKIDIEGAETEVLEDAADELDRVERIFVEHHSFVGRHQSLDRLAAILTGAGFRLHVHPEFVSPQPFVSREQQCGMDLQLNIYGFRGT